MSFLPVLLLPFIAGAGLPAVAGAGLPAVAGAGLPAVAGAGLSAVTTQDPTSPLEAFRARRARAAAEPRPEPPAERLALAVRLGDVGLSTEGLALLDGTTDELRGERDGLAVRAGLLVDTSRPAEAVALLPALLARQAASRDAALAVADLHLLRDDLASASRWARSRPAEDALRLLVEAEVLRRTNDPTAAEALFRRALEAGEPDAGEPDAGGPDAGGAASRALVGVSRCALRAGRIDEAEDLARRALLAGGPAERALEQWGQCLGRAGHAAEAVTVHETVASAFPWSESAHYQLGNGSAHLSYSDLARDAPLAFPAEPAFSSGLAAARALLSRGDLAGARAALRRLTSEWPLACEPPAALASLAWNQGELDESETWARASLSREPRHGRAHAVLTKVLESRRLLVDVNRADWERRFAAAPTPKIPGLETFVTNWSVLTERHRKRVALSVAPLAAFVPALIEGGQTFTIKLLHERLSETPGHEPLADQRIEYDARLWDDVRGCGGNDTVTGIEDVERTVQGGYDTVLHELAHQVHHVLPEVDAARIERAYAAAGTRQAAGTETFLSRYQASSSWEYFAEGVHAASTPRRDRWDSREMRVDRLRRLDPPLLRLVRSILRRTDTRASRAPALVGRALRDAEHDRLADARRALELASAAAPGDETVLATSIHVHLWAGEAPAARAEARAALALHPASAGIAIAAATAELHASGDRQACLRILDAAAPLVDPGRKQEVEVQRGAFLSDSGEQDAAEAVFRSVLAAREEDPTALLGLLGTLALRASPDPATVQDIVTRAVRRRAGSHHVRCAAALAFARTNDHEAAAREIAEALLLASDSDEVLATAALVSFLAGRKQPAVEAARAAIAASDQGDGTSWNDSATLVLALAEMQHDGSQPVLRRAAAVLAALGERRRLPPEYRFIPRDHEHRSIHGFGTLERELWDRLNSELRHAEGGQR